MSLAKLNAKIFEVLDGYMHRVLGRRKQLLFSTLPNCIVEIGAGTGANFRYYAPGTRVIAIEPNMHMHAALRRKTAQYRLELDLRGVSGEQLDLADGSVDAVVSTLVLCTVSDPATLIHEIKRVLRPGGQYVCLEHIAASKHSFVGLVQRVLFRPWRWLFDGCHTHRALDHLLEASGFSELELERYQARTLFIPIRPQMVAVARR